MAASSVSLCLLLLSSTVLPVAGDTPNSGKPKSSECLSWDADGKWCSQSMDEPVVALQVSSQVRKRGHKSQDHLATLAEDRRSIVEEFIKTSEFIKEGIYQDGEAPEKNFIKEDQETIADGGTSFFQMGKSEVTHRDHEAPAVAAVASAAWESNPSDFQLGKPDVVHGASPDGEDTKVPVLGNSDNLQKRSTNHERETPVPKTVVASIVKTLNVATGVPQKGSTHHYLFIAGVLVVLVACYMLLWGGWLKQSRKLYFGCSCRKNKVVPRKPDDEALISGRAIEFRDPVLPEASASFGVPLTPLSDNIVERMSFDITERVRGPMLRADLTRLPGRDAWAKIEISLRGESSSSKLSPCLSCTRVESDAEIETRNVQDAVDSWLSLLVYDKCHDNPEVTGGEQENEDSQSENEGKQIDGSSEQIKPTKSKGKTIDGKKRHRPRLEVRDGQGNDLGMMEPDPMGRYVYHHSDVKMVVDADRDQHAVVVSKDGKKYAIATGLKWDGSPEMAGQEQADFLQVDTMNDAESHDLMSVMLCVMAPVAFSR